MPDKPLSRRDVLTGASVFTGALLLSRMAGAAEDDPAKPDGVAAKVASDSLVLKLADNPELGKVGGWKIFDLGDDKVIVAQTDKGPIARSAICPHKGCEVEYKSELHLFVCPCHNSRFDEDGKVVRGPAKTDLAKYASDSAFIVSKI